MKETDYGERGGSIAKDSIQPPKSIQFDLSQTDDIRALSKLVSELQHSDARWTSQQDGSNYWVVFS